MRITCRTDTFAALNWPGALNIVTGPPDVLRLTDTTSNAGATGDCAVMVIAERDRATARDTTSFIVFSSMCVLPPEGGSYAFNRAPRVFPETPTWFPPSGGSQTLTEAG